MGNEDYSFESALGAERGSDHCLPVLGHELEAAEDGRRHVVGVSFDLDAGFEYSLPVDGRSFEGVRRGKATHDRGSARAPAAVAPRPQPLVAIGGPNSLFAVAQRVLGRDDTRAGTLTRADIRAALGAVTGKEDGELAAAIEPQSTAFLAYLVVPKMALLHAVASNLSSGP